MRAELGNIKLRVTQQAYEGSHNKEYGETVEMNTHDDTRGGKSNVMHTGQTITTKPETTGKYNTQT